MLSSVEHENDFITSEPSPFVDCVMHMKQVGIWFLKFMKMFTRTTREYDMYTIKVITFYKCIAILVCCTIYMRVRISISADIKELLIDKPL